MGLTIENQKKLITLRFTFYVLIIVNEIKAEMEKQGE